MPITFRPARAEDLDPAEALVVRSINDLTSRHGFGAIATLRPAQFQRFSLRDDPAGLWLAEDADEIVGFAFSWVCGELWFLAELFVSPAHQGHGIGNELLRRTHDHARQAGATSRALITFSFNLVSQGLYARHGMYPRLPINNFSVARDALNGRLRDPQLRCIALQDHPAHLAALAQIDAQTLGTTREKHHRYLINDATTQAMLLHSDAECVGYVYIGPNGHIGPFAVTRPDAAAPAFATALSLAAAIGSKQISAFIPGNSNAVLSTAVAHGMRMTFPMVLVSTRDFGDWTRYLPRNPGFM